MKKKLLETLRLYLRIGKASFCLFNCLLVLTLSSCSSIDDAVTNIPADQSELDKIVANQWFLPKDKRLKGFYGGALFSKSLLTSSTIGVDVADTLHYNRLDIVHGGGDFRMALYADGTVRTQLSVQNPGLTLTFVSPFHYEGRYKLSRFGAFETTDMPLVNKPSSFFFNSLTKMRLKGEFDKRTKTFTVQVEAYNKKAWFWRRWQVLKKDVVLQTAVKRDVAAFGKAKGQGIGETTATFHSGKKKK